MGSGVMLGLGKKGREGEKEGLERFFSLTQWGTCLTDSIAANQGGGAGIGRPLWNQLRLPESKISSYRSFHTMTHR